MNVDELMLAAKVREIAQDYRNDERRAHYSAMKVLFENAELQAEMARWDESHPGNPYVERAFQELQNVAALIRKQVVDAGQ